MQLEVRFVFFISTCQHFQGSRAYASVNDWCGYFMWHNARRRNTANSKYNLQGTLKDYEPGISYFGICSDRTNVNVACEHQQARFSLCR